MARSPGTVLRVSRITTFVPAIASTNCRVKVAIPDIRPRKLSAVRSPLKTARAGPANSSKSCPVTTRAPSETLEMNSTLSSDARNTSWATSTPDTMPSCLLTIRAVAEALSRTMLLVVTSPAPRSSSSARLIHNVMSLSSFGPLEESRVDGSDGEREGFVRVKLQHKVLVTMSARSGFGSCLSVIKPSTQNSSVSSQYAGLRRTAAPNSIETESPLTAVADDAVALARTTFQPLTIKDSEVSTMIRDQSSFLQVLCRLAYAASAV